MQVRILMATQYEWKATFDDLIWVRARCFSNNKVVREAGGYTNGCGGND
jgi:hypothetical protein